MPLRYWLVVNGAHIHQPGGGFNPSAISQFDAVQLVVLTVEPGDGGLVKGIAVVRQLLFHGVADGKQPVGEHGDVGG